MATAMQQKELLYDHDEYINLSLLPNDQASRIVHNRCQQYEIPTSAIEDIYPCTALQIGLMTLSQTQPRAYIAHHEFEMAVRVSTQDFQNAWRQLVSETPTLRTRIVEVDDASFYQVVFRSGHVLTHEEHVTQAMSIDEPTTQLLPTFGDQLVHSTIICPEGSRRWLWTVHHAIYDGWSVDLILRRLNELLAASPHEFVNRSVPRFASYVGYLQGLDSLSSQRYWDVELAGYDGQIFPFHIPRSYRPQSNSSAQRQVPLPVETTGFTAASFIKAAWGLLLSTYTGDQDVAFRTTVTGRSAPVAGIRDIVGPTIATVPVRFKTDSAQSVYDFLCTVQRQSTQMIPHEHFGLQRIRLLNEGAERACGFQNLLLIQPGPSQESGKTIKEITVHANNYLTYALTIECFLNQNTVDIVATFDESVIESTQMRRLLDQLAHILKQLIQDIVSKDGSLVRDIQSLPPEDVADITAWNSKPVTRINSCLHHLIEQRVLEFPLSVAVDVWDGSLSYHDLSEQSTQLAQELVYHGVGPEIFVPLCCQKSKWVLVCILAVMKAGGAFVLLDISHPVERLQHIVQSVHAKMVLCSPEQMELGSELGLQTINCRSLSIKFPPTSQVYLPNSVSPQNALYATFTSGSTGTPKASS
jgi:Condensation domain/AMP-binding enzyme